MVVTLNAAAIFTYAANPEIAAAFPFLRPYAAPRKRDCCGSTSPGPDAKRAISALASLPPARQRVFKDLIGATVVVASVVRAGRVVDIRF